MIKHVENVKEFEEKVTSGTVLVDFFATWCGPCKMLAPVLESMDKKGLLEGVLVLKVDVDELSDLARRFHVQSIPTLLLFKDGKIVKTALGYMNENQLLSFVK